MGISCVYRVLGKTIVKICLLVGVFTSEIMEVFYIQQIDKQRKEMSCWGKIRHLPPISDTLLVIPNHMSHPVDSKQKTSCRCL